MGPPAFQVFLTHTHTLPWNSFSTWSPFPFVLRTGVNWQGAPLSCSALTERKSPNVPRPEPGFHSFLNINYRTEHRLWCWTFDSPSEHSSSYHRFWSQGKKLMHVTVQGPVKEATKSVWSVDNRVTFLTHWHWEKQRGPAFHSENCMLNTMHNDLTTWLQSSKYNQIHSMLYLVLFATVYSQKQTLK